MNPNDFNSSEKYTWCYTMSDLRDMYDCLKLVDERFITEYGWALPNDIKVGDTFIIEDHNTEHGVKLLNSFTIPYQYIACFHANI
ncbi:hypothetical protein [Yersinia phage fHe-Yen9-03]|uniref:Uncharacterized protein n=1 Tax=Yersinia phage fHe-Yen9-03 TaxID=2052743 RepID=A0A2C9CZH9_9CAUD|nr:hypothetical protein [Yersinia phage fHe-Yen9-03]